MSNFNLTRHLEKKKVFKEKSIKGNISKTFKFGNRI